MVNPRPAKTKEQILIGPYYQHEFVRWRIKEREQAFLEGIEDKEA